MDPTTDTVRRLDDTKLLWHMDRIIKHYNHGERVPPIHIDCGLTKTCNMSCVYCYRFFQKATDDILSKKALLDNLVTSGAKIGVRSLGFIGDGEPTMNPECFNALVLGKKLGISMAISTNGLLVNNDAKRDAIASSCDWMRFNISASNPKDYERIHGINAFEIVLENIRKFIAYKRKHGYVVDTGLQMVFVPTLMLDDVKPLAKIAIDIGVNYLLIKQCSLPDEGQSGIVNFDVNLYDSHKIIDVLTEAQGLSTDVTKILPKWNTLKLKGKRNYGHCVSVQVLPELSGDGGLYPCAYFFGGRRPDLCYGNLEEKSLEEIIYSDRYWEIVKCMNTEFDPHTECKGVCRQDKTNEFIWDYIHPPRGINFI